MEPVHNKRRGLVQGHEIYGRQPRWTLEYDIPLKRDRIYDFFDALKSRYAAAMRRLDYELERLPRPSKLVKLDILLNGEIDRRACRFIVHARFRLRQSAARCTEKLKENDPAAACSKFRCRRRSDGKIIARETSIKALRKRRCWPSATAAIFHERRSCSKNRRKAKSARRTFGTVAVPSEAFIGGVEAR